MPDPNPTSRPAPAAHIIGVDLASRDGDYTADVASEVMLDGSVRIVEFWVYRKTIEGSVVDG